MRPLVWYVNQRQYRHDKHERLLERDDSLLRFCDSMYEMDEWATGDPGDPEIENARRLRIEAACYLQVLYRQKLKGEGRESALPVALAFRDLVVYGDPAAAMRFLVPPEVVLSA